MEKRKGGMVKVDEWATIRTLRAKGVSIRKIARLCRVSRNTVRKIIKEEAWVVYKREPKGDHGLKGFEKDLQEMVEKKFIGSRILEELKKKGYSGSSVTFYRYLKKQGLSKLSNKVSMRYETAPGEQYQFDWSMYRVRVGRQECQVYCFLVVSVYSRHKAGIFAYMNTQQSVLDRIESSFHDLGETAKQLLIDNATSMVCDHRGEDIVFNENLEVKVKDYGPCLKIPRPREKSRELLKALDARMPMVLPHRELLVVTRKKLPEQRRML